MRISDACGRELRRKRRGLTERSKKRGAQTGQAAMQQGEVLIVLDRGTPEEIDRICCRALT